MFDRSIGHENIARLVWTLLLLTPVASQLQAADAPPPSIPELAWEERSDWVNVRTKVQPPAKGDGVVDDTAAIQAALNGMAEGTTIYFPPGTYRISKTLIAPPGRFAGVTFLGHGRTTTLAWDGEAGGRMFWTNEGMLYSRFVGLTWDGRGKAAVGFDHAAQKIYETEMRHEHEAYRDFTEAGIRVGVGHKVASAEMLYENCLFERCGHGVSLLSFNILDHTFDHCEFRQCGVGVNGGKGTNFYVRNCHFEQSKAADIVNERCEQGSSVRRCTSRGSKTFLTYSSSVGPLVVQDCHVEGWTDPGGAVRLNGAPVLLFDCVFTMAPVGGGAPVVTGRAGQRLIVSGNRADGAGGVVKTPEGGKAIDIPAAVPGGVIKSASQSFLRSIVRIPSKVFDVKRDFGAKGDGNADDTAAIAKAIDAARTHGKGAIAYVPAGRYAVTSTLHLTGSDYFVGGTGFRSMIIWKGKPGGTTVEITDPDRITLENILIGHHDGGPSDSAIDILQRGGSGKPTFMRYDRVWAWGMYQKKPLEKGLRFVGLGANDRVHFREVNGNLHLTDCAAATVYLGLSYEGTLLVEGKSAARGGFMGGGVRLATVTDPALWIKDNQSFVISDFYSESSLQIVRMSGDAALPPGRLTLQGPKFELVKAENTAFTVDNYRGEVVMGPYQFYPGNPLHRFDQKGDAPFAMTMVGSLFYQCKPEFKLAPSAKLAVVGTDTVALNKADGIDSVPGLTDTDISQAIPRLAKGLDDLRRLGAVDVEMTRVE